MPGQNSITEQAACIPPGFIKIFIVGIYFSSVSGKRVAFSIKLFLSLPMQIVHYLYHNGAKRTMSDVKKLCSKSHKISMNTE